MVLLEDWNHKNEGDTNWDLGTIKLKKKKKETQNKAGGYTLLKGKVSNAKSNVKC